MKNSTLICVLAVLATVAMGIDVGDRLAHTFNHFIPAPFSASEAIANGWTATTGRCVSGYGILYEKAGEDYRMYYTPMGQVATLGIIRHGAIPAGAGPKYANLWAKTPVGSLNDGYEFAVFFRDPAQVCDGKIIFRERLGDRVVAGNPALNTVREIPLNNTATKQLGWTEGGCIPKMGTHWGYNLATGKPGLPSVQTDLFPVLPMYNQDTGRLVSLQFWSDAVEKTAWIPLGKGSYDGPTSLGYPSPIFCFNLCSPCGFGLTTTFFPFHWHLTDPALNRCDKPHCRKIDFPLLAKDVFEKLDFLDIFNGKN